MKLNSVLFFKRILTYATETHSHHVTVSAVIRDATPYIILMNHSYAELCILNIFIYLQTYFSILGTVLLVPITNQQESAFHL